MQVRASQRQDTESDISIAQNESWTVVGYGLGRKVLCPTAMGVGWESTVCKWRKSSSGNDVEDSDERVD